MAVISIALIGSSHVEHTTTNMAGMTRSQAIDALNEGKLVKHEYFTDGEYLEVVNGIIVTEDGYAFGKRLYEEDFFKDGWSIVPTSNEGCILTGQK